MDIATGRIACNLMQLAENIRNEKYGPDTDFDQTAFLEELEDKIVRPLGYEIIME